MSAPPQGPLTSALSERHDLAARYADLLANSGPWLDGMLEAVCVVDGLSLQVIDANPSACLLLGQPRDALVGLPITQLLTSPEDAVFWLEVQQGRSEHLHSDTLVACAGGEYRRIERRVHRLPLADGRPVFVLGMLDRSAQHAAEERLEKLLSELRATIESTADGILVTDLHGAIQGFNRRFSQMWNVPEALLVQRDDVAIYEWMRSQVENDQQYGSRLEAIADAPLLEGHDTVTLKDGRVLERVTLPQYGRGLPIGRVFSFRDISDRLAAQARLHLAATVFESSLDPIFITDADYALMAVNQACQNLLGQSAQALVGRPLDALFFDPAGQLVLAEVLARLPVTGRWDGELSCIGGRGTPVPVRISLVYETESGSGVQTAGLRNTHCIGVAHDLSERHADRQRIRDLAYTDSLTGLPNRMLLAERMEHSIAVARREDQTLAVLFIDLDRFKHINDSLGHQYGDRVLVEVAQRIKHCLRVVDTVARQGGDEFVAILHNCDVHTAEQVGSRILAALSEPFDLKGMSFTVTCSIGVAMFPTDGQSPADLIKNADAAMYGVKESGRASLRFYQSAMNGDLLRRIQLDHRMRTALATGQFQLHYQPQLHLSSGRIVGAEALIRWHDEEMGNVSPAQFISVAEDTGFIVTLGDWVLREAVKQAAQWRRQGLQVPVSINVSALQFRQSYFVERVVQALEDAGLPPQMLELELTESILIGDANEILARLQRLAVMGVHLAIDDFGTGYSSLAYLKRLPIHRLKIDRSFVDDLATDEGDQVITVAVIQLAHSLRLKVIAEGVETEVQRQFLAQAGCDEYQGYLCSPALPVDRFVALAQGLNPPG